MKSIRSKMEKKEFKKKYPKLAEEIDTGTSKTDIQLTHSRYNSKRKFAGYNPDVVDFIRRCANVTEALEIIEYLKSKGEIQLEEARILRDKLEIGGLKSFGKKKESGYYERESYELKR